MRLHLGLSARPVGAAAQRETKYGASEGNNLEPFSAAADGTASNSDPKPQSPDSQAAIEPPRKRTSISPLTLRLTPEERTKLEALAAGMTLSAYIRACVYDPIAKGDVLVVDEAGMIGMRQLARITTKMNEIGAKLVQVGDPDQLQPIEAGTPFRRVAKDHGAARLAEIHRQKANWQKQASRDLAVGDLSKAVEQYRRRDAVIQVHDRASALEALVETYAIDVAANGNTKSRLAFAHKRKDVHALNQAIRAALRSDGDAKPETLFSTESGNRAFAADDRIVFTRNNKDIGVKNGMLGTVITAQDGEVSVALD